MKSIASSCLALAVLLCLAIAPAAAAERPVKVEIEKVGLAVPEDEQGAVLVAVRYPIQLLGRPLRLKASLLEPGRGTIQSWTVRARAGGGPEGRPERRRAFTYVHRIDLSPSLARRIRQGERLSVRIGASGALDVNGDGVEEIDSDDREVHLLPRAYAGPGLCATVPELRAEPGERVATRLPACGARVRWRIDRGPEHGVAGIRDGQLTYDAGVHRRGTESIRLTGRAAEATSSDSTGTFTELVQVTVERSEGVVVRAMGDSVTAGFGYYEDGSQMAFSRLFSCKPGAGLNDACSSNSTNRSNKGTAVNYALDYGLSNNVSWAAQWANQHAVTDYANLAISGAEPANWAPGGQFYSTTERVEEEDPDYILMTVGANPLLSEMLFGVDHMGCAVWADLFGRYERCIEAAFEAVHLGANLKSLYQELVKSTDATIYLMQYPLSVPSSAIAYSTLQIATMVQLLNQEIASVAGEVGSARIRVIAPPHFDVGLDISPVYPSQYRCGRFFPSEVDGPSVQSAATQAVLRVLHPLAFCRGDSSWVISADTGIHPSALGYTQMASQVPAPE